MNIKDCKCGAKYVRGLPAIDNGQILIGEQYVCTECWNRDIEQNLVKLAKHASALLDEHLQNTWMVRHLTMSVLLAPGSMLARRI